MQKQKLRYEHHLVKEVPRPVSSIHNALPSGIGQLLVQSSMGRLEKAAYELAPGFHPIDLMKCHGLYSKEFVTQ